MGRWGGKGGPPQSQGGEDVALGLAREGERCALMGPGFPRPELGQAPRGWADTGP